MICKAIDWDSLSIGKSDSLWSRIYFSCHLIGLNDFLGLIFKYLQNPVSDEGMGVTDLSPEYSANWGEGSEKGYVKRFMPNLTLLGDSIVPSTVHRSTTPRRPTLS